MFFLQANPEPITHSLSYWSTVGDIAQAVIAAANILLAVYIFFYQKQKDIKTERSTAKLNEQNIKLQWFKELIIQPNIQSINVFYEHLHSIKDKISTPDINIDTKEDINNVIKAELSTLRKSLIDVLLFIDKPFADRLLSNLDGLIDEITNVIFNDELKLNMPSVYEKHIASKISYSRNDLIAQIYNYKGVE